MLLRALLENASPGGAYGRISVLILHRVLPEIDPLFPEEVDASSFDALCGWLHEWFNVLPLDDAVARWKQGSLPSRALAITFDDGYADNHEVALPILNRHGLTATFFIATGFLDGGRMWNDTIIEAVRRTPGRIIDLCSVQPLGLGLVDVSSTAARRRIIDVILARVKYLPAGEREAVADAVAEAAGCELPRGLMMTSADVHALRAAGMTIGAHTVTHPILARLPSDGARREILNSRQALEAILGERVGLFAYPNGKPGRDFTKLHAAMVGEAGFDAAFSTAWGSVGPSTPAFEIPRFTPWDRSRFRFGLRMLSNLRRPACAGLNSDVV
jgi:peptidoglycan/xylan/chitin deacetylase (PgdA/CDA1 family)